MYTFFQNLLTASLQGSVIILAVLVLRRILQKTSKKMICLLWVLAFARLLIPTQIESKLSLQPAFFSALPDLSAQKWVVAVGILWLTVAACFAVYSIVSYLRMKRIVQESIKIHGGWLCDRIDTAFILGFIDPQIYIPMNATPEERHHILEHERTHLDKGDLWLKMLGFVALALHWFNPLVWLAYSLYSKDIEMACDERVVQFMDLKERKQYSMALLNYSSNEAHMAACPIAFGEVSVKERILFILDYKRPGFWITLVTLLSISFVAGCLLTSPAKFDLQSMTPEEIVAKCIEENHKIRDRESSYVHVDYIINHSDGSTVTETYDVRRHGENFLSLCSELTTSTLRFEGRSAMHYGDYWVDADHDVGSGTWSLDLCNPENKLINYTNGIHVLSETSASIGVSWEDSFSGDKKGTITYFFHKDGSVEHMEIEFGPKEGSGKKYRQILTFIDEEPHVTYNHIKAVAAEVVTMDELKQYRSEQESVTEIPSNKNYYDQHFEYGSTSYRWNFFNDERSFRLAAEEATHTGLTLVWSEAQNGYDYQDGSPVGGSITGNSLYWLEEFVNGTWEKVSYRNYDPTVETCEEETVSLDTALYHETVLDWSKLYGTLDGGFYRVGRFYTFETASGQFDTKVCYAKFRLFDRNQKENLQACKDALDKLMSSNSYHLTHKSYDIPGANYSIVTQIWKSGNSYLSDTQYPYDSDPTKLYGRRGSMIRDSMKFDLEWSGKTVDSPLSKWSSADYLDESHFTMWSLPLFWDAMTENVSRDGSTYTILIYYGEETRNPYSERVFTINEDGMVSSVKCYQLPALGCADSEKVLTEEMVLHSTSPDEIAKVINNIDVSKAPPFSWEIDSVKYTKGDAGVRTVNFVNNTEKSIRTPAEAIAAAIKDCTLPAAVGMEPGTNMSAAYYDESAQMWKVEFTASWDDTIYEAVYLTNKGITQLAVQRTLQPNS